ncbi:MAG: hypothetical protein R6U31_08110 [bacterium]
MNIFGIFTGHHDYSASAVNAALSIIGDQDDYRCLSNRGRDINTMYSDIEGIVNAHDSEHFFLFIDFYGSSFSIPANRIKDNFSKKVTLLFGYNLPVIMDFFLHRSKKSPDELYDKLVSIGKEAIS